MQNNLRQKEIERFANYVKSNPDKWKKVHTEFIDSQFKKHEEFIKRISLKPNHKDIISKLFFDKHYFKKKKLS